MLSFKILGPLEIVTETRVLRPRGSKQNALLTALLAASGRLVSSEDLIAELWGEDYPDRVENDLQAHISRLRRRLATLQPGHDESKIVTHVSGYELTVADDELDATSFIKGVETIRNYANADPREQVSELRSLLKLWRGQAFGNQKRGPIVRSAAARYEEHRITAYNLLFERELQSGNHAKIIPELRELTVKYEFHEKFQQQLMIALYRSGRQADALSVYRELRRHLSDQLGLDPSPVMQQYEQAVLQHNTSIDDLRREMLSSAGVTSPSAAGPPGQRHT